MFVVRRVNTADKPEAPIRVATAQELIDYNRVVRNISESTLLSSRATEHYFKPADSTNTATGLVFTKQ